MDLKKTIDCLRRTHASDDQIYLVLALVELGATDTPFFAGLEGEKFIASLLEVLAILEQRFQESKVYDPEDFYMFLSLHDHKLKFNSGNLDRLVAEIKKQGEENYEFTKFVNVGD